MPLLDFSSAKYSLSIGGKAMKLTQLTVNLQFNAPPMVTGSAIPAKLVDKKVVPASDTSIFWDAYKKADKAVGKESINLRIGSIGEEGGIGFNAQGWILGSADVSVAASAEAGGHEINFTAMHPICNLERYPANIGPASPSPSYGDVKGSNFIDVVKSAMEAYMKKVPKPTKEQPGYKLMQEGKDKLTEYLQCEGVDISKLAGIFKGISSQKNVEDGFRKYILSCLESGGENSSMWEFVLGSLAATLSLRLWMDKSDLSAKKLKLRPSIPYTPEKVQISTSEIASIYSNSGDWVKCTGVSTWAAGPTGLPWNAAHQYDMDKFVPSAYCSVVAKEKMLKMCSVNLPGWFEAVANHCSPPSWNSPFKANDAVDMEKWCRIIKSVSCKKLLTQQLLDLYRQGTDIYVKKVFSFKDSKGNVIIPGMTCCINDGGGGAGLMFNIASVQHNFNMNNKQAETVLRGNYVRAGDFSLEVEGGEDSTLIMNGCSRNKNYIWS